MQIWTEYKGVLCGLCERFIFEMFDTYFDASVFLRKNLQMNNSARLLCEILSFVCDFLKKQCLLLIPFGQKELIETKGI